MHHYEIWVVDIATRQCTVEDKVTAVDECEAIKMCARKLGTVFYYENWKSSHNAYIQQNLYGEVLNCRVILNQMYSYNSKLEKLNKVFNDFIKKKKQKTCDCGSSKVYGLNCTHSHWCSISETTTHG